MPEQLVADVDPGSWIPLLSRKSMYPTDAPELGQVAWTDGPIAPPASRPPVHPVALIFVVLQLDGWAEAACVQLLKSSDNSFSILSWA
jgi:hypothetical protein